MRKVTLAPHETHYHDELTGITLSRIQVDAPLEVELPEDEVIEEVLNPISNQIEKDVRLLSGIDKAIRFGILIANDTPPAEPVLTEEEQMALNAGDPANTKDVRRQTILREKARELLDNPVNDIKKEIRTITNLELLELLLAEEKSKDKIRASLVDVINQRMRSEDVMGPGIVQVFPDDEEDKAEELQEN